MMSYIKTSERLSFSNALLYFATCVIVGTGLLLELRMDDEEGAIRILGMERDDWGEIHFGSAFIFSVLVVMHLYLNRIWIMVIVTRTKWAVPVLIAGLGFVAALLIWPADQKGAGTVMDACRSLLW